MAIADILDIDRVVMDVTVTSKKRALERLSELMAAVDQDMSPGKVFDSLLVRERLGSTGLGFGVAIPHARHPGASDAVGAFMRMTTPVDFDAMDREPVDLVFGLLVPDESSDEHVKTLGELATLFSDAALRARLRGATSTDDLFAALTGH